MTGTLASRVRVHSVKVLDRFASDHRSVCTRHPRRGLCVRQPLLESGFRVLGARHGNLIHEKERLEVWPYTVLPRPEIEDGAKPLERETAEAPRERRRVGAVDD